MSLLIAGGPLLAQDSGLPFLQIGVDAQGMAMGEAQVASAQGAFSTFWNPAGLAVQSGNQAGLAHHRWVAGTRTYAANTRFSAGESSGVSLFLLANGNGELERRDGQGPPSGVFSAQYLSVGAGYGKSFGNLRVGVAVKYLSERIAEASANGYAFDAGVQTSLHEGSVGLGAAIANVGSITELNATSTTVPTTVRVGGYVYPFRVASWLDNASLLTAKLEAEMSYLTPSDRIRFHFGAEAELFEMLLTRIGFVTNDSLRGPTFGLGLKAVPFRVDYAIVPFEGGFGGPGHVISIDYTW